MHTHFKGRQFNIIVLLHILLKQYQVTSISDNTQVITTTTKAKIFGMT